EMSLEAVGVDTVGVEEVPAVVDLQALLAQQPLIDFNLALVADLPLVIERDLAVLGGGFVVDNDQLAITLAPTPHLPDVVQRARDQKVGAIMEVRDAFEVVAPVID